MFDGGEWHGEARAAMALRTHIPGTIMRAWVVPLLFAAALAGCVDDDTGMDMGPKPGTDAWDQGIVQGPTGPFEAFGDALTVETPLELRGIWLDDGVLYASSRAGLTLYDVRDPAAPVELAHIQNGTGTPPNIFDGNCGSHFGGLVDGQDAFVMGWYDGGTLLVDFSDPTAPVLLDQADAQNGETWDAQYWNGHVFNGSGDLVATPLT